MSDEELMSQSHDCGGDAAAYVLGALEPEEAERFRAHLDGCVVCRDEVLAFQQVTDALPMSAPQHPVPRGLRRRVLGQVHEEARAARASPRRSGFALGRPALAGGLLAALAVVVVVAVVALGGSGGSHTHVYAASTGAATVRVTGGQAELVVDRLPQPASGYIYEIWLKRAGGAPQPTKALFSVTQNGSAEVGVPGDIRGVSELMVTEEPAGGTLAPTTQPVIVTHL